MLKNKINALLLIEVNNANPNGDPINGNRPRQDNDDYGLISAECIKRKIRNVAQYNGEKIFVQMQDRSDDGAKSLKDRLDSLDGAKEAIKAKDTELLCELACKEWYDTRLFGQVFAFDKAFSASLTGPVSVSIAKSVCPVEVEEMQITKSVNGTTEENKVKSSDTMGTRYYINHGLYVVKLGISPYLAEKTNLSEEDVEKLKEYLKNLFVGDSSSARPDGSMCVRKLLWWTHDSKSGVNPLDVYNSVTIKPLNETPKSWSDYEVEFDDVPGTTLEVLV